MPLDRRASFARVAALGLAWALLPGMPRAQVPPEAPTPNGVTAIYAVDHGLRLGPDGRPDSLRDAGPAIERAWAVARRARRPGEIAEVRLPAGTVGYLRMSLDPDSVALVGVGGAVLVAVPGSDVPRAVAASTLGRPETRLAVLPGWAARYAAGRPDLTGRPEEPSRLSVAPGPPYRPDAVGNPTRSPVRRHHRIVFRDLVLDGREAEAAEAFRAMTDARLRSDLQDGIAHAGVNASAHGGVDLCADLPREIRLNTGGVYRQPGHVPGLRVTLDRVVIRGYTAAGAIGGGCSRWEILDSRVERAAYNHALYHTDGGGPADAPGGEAGTWGGWRNLTLVPRGWTEIISSYGLAIDGLRVEAGSPSPLREGPEIFDLRGGTATVRRLALDAPLGQASVPPRLWISHGGTLVVEP